MHPGDNNKRTRSSSESSLRTIPDADLVAEMTYTIKVLNDKRELFEEQKKLDKEIIQKLEIKISEIVNKAKVEKDEFMVTLEVKKAENASLSDEVVKLKGKLLTTEAAKEQLKLDTDKRIVELTKQIKLLEVRLASMDKAKDSQDEEMDTNEDVN